MQKSENFEFGSNIFVALEVQVLNLLAHVCRNIFNNFFKMSFY